MTEETECTGIVIMIQSLKCQKGKNLIPHYVISSLTNLPTVTSPVSPLPPVVRGLGLAGCLEVQLNHILTNSVKSESENVIILS